MENIPLPKQIATTLDPENNFKGEAVIEPLYPGYGHTIANALRRVMLSSLPGAAIYAFKIKGISHEFTGIDHVKEDVVDISLNLKRINLKCHASEPVVLKLKVSGEKVVTAADFEANADVEIANPDFPILTMTDPAATLEMTVWVRQGRGYVTVESRKDEELEVNAIAIDSIFSPVSLVGFNIDNVRVGDRTDFDKITLQIETNGTIAVEEALKDSAKILAQHFSFFVSDEAEKEVSTEDDADTEDPSDEESDEDEEVESDKKE